VWLYRVRPAVVNQKGSLLRQAINADTCCYVDREAADHVFLLRIDPT